MYPLKNITKHNLQLTTNNIINNILLILMRKLGLKIDANFGKSNLIFDSLVSNEDSFPH